MSDKPTDEAEDMTGKSTLTPEEHEEKWTSPNAFSVSIGNKVVWGGPKTPQERRNAKWMEEFLKAHRARRRNRI
jgi:hypothetical protein